MKNAGKAFLAAVLAVLAGAWAGAASAQAARPVEFPLADRAGELQDPVGERRLPMVYVRDYRKIAN